MLDKNLYDLLLSSVQALGYELWGVERIAQGRKGSLLRIYIDHADGILIDDCVKVSHQVDGILTVEDPIQGEYTLEVSSPGWDRPLFFPTQYDAFIGEKIKVSLARSQNGQRHFTGQLIETNADGIHLEIDGQIQQLDWQKIQQGRILL
jgi:ribosome maturation factor RimP